MKALRADGDQRNRCRDNRIFMYRKQFNTGTSTLALTYVLRQLVQLPQQIRLQLCIPATRVTRDTGTRATRSIRRPSPRSILDQLLSERARLVQKLRKHGPGVSTNVDMIRDTCTNCPHTPPPTPVPSSLPYSQNGCHEVVSDRSVFLNNAPL